MTPSEKQTVGSVLATQALFICVKKIEKYNSKGIRAKVLTNNTRGEENKHELQKEV